MPLQADRSAVPRRNNVGTVNLPSGERIPALGQGTWRMAQDPHRRAAEIAALRLGLDLGLSLIDTAEAYDDGEIQRLVGEAIHGRRDDVFVVVRALPGRASARAMVAGCEGSLRRLRTDRIDLYLLQTGSGLPLEETLVAFGALLLAGKIRYWGVADFDVADLTALAGVRHGTVAAANQVQYSLARRDIERGVLPFCSSRAIPLIVYASMAGGALIRHPALSAIANRGSTTTAQMALAWVLRHPGMCVLSGASSSAHVRENRGALDVSLSASELAALDHSFPSV